VNPLPVFKLNLLSKFIFLKKIPKLSSLNLIYTCSYKVDLAGKMYMLQLTVVFALFFNTP
jgi:hypothetical protein